MSFGFSSTISATFSVVIFTAVIVSEAMAEKADYVQSGNKALQQGRDLWLDNCEGCHGYGIADAPVPMQPGDWKHRVIKDREVLYRHAIEGFIGLTIKAKVCRFTISRCATNDA